MIDTVENLQVEAESLIYDSTVAKLRGYDMIALVYDAEFDRLLPRIHSAANKMREGLIMAEAMIERIYWHRL